MDFSREILTNTKICQICLFLGKIAQYIFDKWEQVNSLIQTFEKKTQIYTLFSIGNRSGNWAQWESRKIPVNIPFRDFSLTSLEPLLLSTIPEELWSATTFFLCSTRRLKHKYQHYWTGCCNCKNIQTLHRFNYKCEMSSKFGLCFVLMIDLLDKKLSL